MASAKLTLSLDKSVIEKGKLYAKIKGTSLSKLVEQLLREEAKQIIPKGEPKVDMDELLALAGPGIDIGPDHDPQSDREIIHQAVMDKYYALDNQK